MAELKISEVFAESANRLPKEAKTKLLKVFMLLTSNPHHPSLQLKKIKGAARNDIYECRLDQFWRLVVQDLGGMLFQLVYVGPHDEAIERGAVARETPASYGIPLGLDERIDSFLSGGDTALVFFSLRFEDAAALLGIPSEDTSSTSRLWKC